jgi:hypothetical protein
LYAGKSYDIRGLLIDPKPGKNWEPEPLTKATFECDGSSHVIDGCFHHRSCARFSLLGEPFIDFCCPECQVIPKETDFRLRVLCEDDSLTKRGSRSIGLGRQLGYLSTSELASQSRLLHMKLNHEKLKVWYHKKKVVQLRVSRPDLKDVSLECIHPKDLLVFCQNIVATHRSGAFGGKPALWDFLRDVAQNLNENTKSFTQAMKIYGGRRMCNLFSLNLKGPSFSTIKRENQEGVHFIPGEYFAIFKSIAEIYSKAKEIHGIYGPIPVMLAEGNVLFYAENLLHGRLLQGLDWKWAQPIVETLLQVLCPISLFEDHAAMKPTFAQLKVVFVASLTCGDLHTALMTHTKYYAIKLAFFQAASLEKPL